MTKRKRRALALAEAGSAEVGVETVKRDTSPFVYQESKLKTPVAIRQRYALNEKQAVIMEAAMDKGTKIVMIDGLWGSGKAQPLTAKILTPVGWRGMGDIKVGDEVFAADGKPCKVLGVFPQGEKEIYEVTFSDGSKTECCGEHLWLTQTEAERNRHKRARNGGNPIYTKIPLPPKVRSTDEIAKTVRLKRGHLNHSIPLVKPIEFPQKEHLISPYILGVLLGDGCLLHKTSFTVTDREIVDRVKSEIPPSVIVNEVIENFEYSIVRSDRGKGVYCPNPVTTEIKRLGLYGHHSYEKFIPDEYLFDSVENRIAMLRGLMDTDGTTDEHHSSLCTTSPYLADQVTFLVRSLGGTSVTNERYNTFTYKGEKKTGRLSYKVTVKLPNEISPFHLSRKRDRLKKSVKYHPIRYFSSIKPIGKKQAQCIMIDHPSHLYVTDDCIVTHNTYLAVLASLQLMNEKRVSSLVYLRSPLEASSTAKIGTLPGSLEERLASYNSILFDKLAELIPKPDIDRLKKEERIECIPVGLIQGKTFSCKAVIVDEAASLSHDDLMLVVSRLGERSVLFIVGDSTHQLTIGAKSGFRRFFETFLDEDSMNHGVYTFELRDRDDIVRSGILRWVMEKTGAVKYAQEASAGDPMFEPKPREGTRNIPTI